MHVRQSRLRKKPNGSAVITSALVSRRRLCLFANSVRREIVTDVILPLIAFTARTAHCRVLAILSFLAAAECVCTAQPPRSADDVWPVTVLGAVIGEDVLIDNAKFVEQRSRVLTDEQKYRDLLHWVVLAAADKSIRMQAQFRETLPTDEEWSTDIRLCCPAVNLVEAARITRHLPELRERVASAAAMTNGQRRSKAAMQFLIDCAQKDLTSAAKRIALLSSLSSERVDYSDAGYPPEAVAVWSGLRNPSARSLVENLASQMYRQQLLNSSRSSNRASRDHMVSQFGLQRHMKDGGAAAAYFRPPALKNWIAFAVNDAKASALRLPQANWNWDGERLHVRSCSGQDVLCYRVPLTGDFEAACEFTSNSLGDLHFMYGGEHVTLSGSHRQVRVGSVRHAYYQDLTPSLRNQGRKLFCRLVVRDGVCSTYLNGTLIRERQIAAGDDPWLTLRATSALRQPSIGRIRISGTPTVPKSVDLCGGSRLHPWWSHMTNLLGATWTYVEDERGNGLDAPLQPHLTGTHNENVLRYYRPLAEDGELTYDFFYEPDRTHVHPVWGDVAFLLHPDGIRRHRFTNGRYDRSGADPVMSSELNEKNPVAVPLKPGQWNRCRLKIDGNVVLIHVNDSEVGSYERSSHADRIFGLFHYSDHTQAKVRNLSWQGNWPDAAFVEDDLQLLDRNPNGLDADLAAMETYEHDFRTQGLSSTDFDAPELGQAGTSVVDGEGVIQVVQSGDGWESTDLTSNFRPVGDFDIEATFDNLRLSQPEYGGCAVRLQMQDGGVIQLSRRNRDTPENRVFLSWRELRDKREFQLAVDELTSGAMSGRLRLAKRGNNYKMLFADGDSPFFRLVAERTVKDVAEPRLLQLRVLRRDAAWAAVTWSKLQVSGDRLERFRFSVRLRSLTADERNDLVGLTDLQELVLDGTDVSDADLATLKNHDKLELLYLKSTPVTSHGITHLSKLQKLHTLHLTGSEIDDAAGPAIATLTSLEELGISSTAVGDRIVEYLSQLPRLQVLGMRGATITEASVPFFTKMKTLRRLDLRRTNLPAAAVEEIQKALPECNVQH